MPYILMEAKAQVHNTTTQCWYLHLCNPSSSGMSKGLQCKQNNFDFFDFLLFVNVPQTSWTPIEILLHNKIETFKKKNKQNKKNSADHPWICEKKTPQEHTDTLAPVRPQILLAVQRKRDGSLEEGQVSTDGALSVSLPLSLSFSSSATDGPNHTYFSLTCPIAT